MVGGYRVCSGREDVLRREPTRDTTDPVSGLQDPDPSGVRPERPQMPEPSPELHARLDATDRLLEGRTPQEKLKAARDLYYDADGMPQLRRDRIRALPDPEH